ncbi:MAG: hypothetical protein M1832_004751 [Thelocarpon impressellum]|nr:MAG: hypothetical protein M1832_004751 [Thelocarpon impressellum]
MAAPPPNKSRLPLYAGLIIAGAGGYYLYSAGGDPKVAQKKIEHDAARASSAVKSEIPGKGKEVQKKGEQWATEAGSKVDRTVHDAKAKLTETEAKAEQYRRETGKELGSKIDQFDKKVEEGASKAKSGVSGWFK